MKLIITAIVVAPYGFSFFLLLSWMRCRKCPKNIVSRRFGVGGVTRKFTGEDVWRLIVGRLLMLLKRELYKTVALNLRRRAYIVNWHLFRFSHFIFINHFLQSMKIFSFFCIDFIILSKWKTRSSIQQEFSCAGLVYKDFNSMAVCSYLYPFIMADIQKSGFFFIMKIFNFSQTNCDALHDLVPFVQFKRREKHPRRSVTFTLQLY